MTEKAKLAIRGNNIVLGALCMHFNRHMKTIELWIDENNKRLLSPASIKIITKHTGLKEIEIKK